MKDVGFKLYKLAGTNSGISPFELHTIFKSYIFPRGEYASCIWIFRVFLLSKRVFYKSKNITVRFFISRESLCMAMESTGKNSTDFTLTV